MSRIRDQIGPILAALVVVAVAASVVARWEGNLDPLEPVEVEPPHAPSHGL